MSEDEKCISCGKKDKILKIEKGDSKRAAFGIKYNYLVITYHICKTCYMTGRGIV